MAVAAPPLHAVVLEFGNRFTRHGVFAAMPQDAIASVSGTVADGSSKPLPAAAVTVKNAAGVTQTARTDSKGKYWIGGLGADTYTITVRAKGYKNFEMAAHVIYECRTEIDQETKNDAVIGHLKTAAVALEAFNGGDAAASVQAAMRSIRDIVDKLPD